MTDEQVNRFMSGVGKWDTHEREHSTEDTFDAPPRAPLPPGFTNSPPRVSYEDLLDGYETADPLNDEAMANPLANAAGVPPPAPQMILPTDSASRKAIPLFRGLVKYFPRALAAVAHLSFLANEKHNPGEPLHWSKNKSSDHLDACLRHMVDAGTIDPEFGLFNDVGLAWRALANLELFLEAQEQQ